MKRITISTVKACFAAIYFMISAMQPATAQTKVTIDDPLLDLQPVATDYEVKGGADLPDGYYVWILIHAKEQGNFWHPQAQVYIDPVTKKWKQKCYFGGIKDVGKEFEIAAITVKAVQHQQLEEYMVEAARTGNYYAIPMPPTVLPPVFRSVKKERHRDGLFGDR